LLAPQYLHTDCLWYYVHNFSFPQLVSMLPLQKLFTLLFKLGLSFLFYVLYAVLFQMYLFSSCILNVFCVLSRGGCVLGFWDINLTMCSLIAAQSKLCTCACKAVFFFVLNTMIFNNVICCPLHHYFLPRQ
jgi:hypothetical protein